jgi:tyrosyl-tRNA synthetase
VAARHQQGGVKVDGAKIGAEFAFEAGRDYLVQVGKRKFKKVRIA